MLSARINRYCCARKRTKNHSFRDLKLHGYFDDGFARDRRNREEKPPCFSAAGSVYNFSPPSQFSRIYPPILFLDCAQTHIPFSNVLRPVSVFHQRSFRLRTRTTLFTVFIFQKHFDFNTFHRASDAFVVLIPIALDTRQCDSYISIFIQTSLCYPT